MKKTLLGIIIAWALSVSPASAQAAWTAPVFNWGSGWCPTCYVYMNVDTPNLSTPWTGTIAGWGFECASGEPIDRIDVYYSNQTAFHRADSYLLDRTIARLDVSGYFLKAGCPRVSTTTGWAVGFHTRIPSGTWRMTIVAWKGMVSTTQTGLVVVP